MGKFHLSIGTIALAAALAACGSNAATAPPPSAITPSTTAPTPTPSSSPTPPVMPEAAKGHTAAGAKAFVKYYVELIDYAESTLDTKLLAELSLDSCVGCQGGIKGINKIEGLGGRLEGVSQKAVDVTTTALKKVPPTAVVSFAIDIASERVVVPGKKTVVHPAGRTAMLAVLIGQEDGSWRVGDLRTRP